jgi:tellurite resistance protein TerC
MSAPPFPLWAWLVFVGLVPALLLLDLFVLHRKAREVPFKEALWLSGFWIAVSLAFGEVVWYLGGLEAEEEYLAAYLLEHCRPGGGHARASHVDLHLCQPDR